MNNFFDIVRNSSCLLFAFVILALPARSAEETNTLSAIKQRGILYWGADAEGGAPNVFVNPQNPEELIGFEVDLANEIAKKIGVKAEMKQNSWDALVPALTRKDFDVIINGLEITEPRKNLINFSKPYYVYSQQIVVQKENTDIQKLTDLRGKVVGTLASSVAMRILEDIGVDAKVYPGVVEPYRDLADSRLDAVVLDLPIAIYYAKPNTKLKFVGEPLGEGYYAIGIRKEDTDLTAKLDSIITELIANGTMNAISQKWNIWTTGQANISDYKASKPSETAQKGTFQKLDKYLPLLLQGAFVTIQISVLSMFFAVVLGLMLAIFRLYFPAPIRFLCVAYVEMIRGTPLLIQLYLIYYGLPNIGLKLDAMTAAVAGLAINYSAYEAENYRAGIQSIPRGQMEAAMALGMTKWMALRKIIIPQAIKNVLPPVSNDFIALFKDSSLVSVITMVELTKVYGYLAASSFDYIGLGLLTAAIYFMMSYPASLFARRLEKNMAHGNR